MKLNIELNPTELKTILTKHFSQNGRVVKGITINVSPGYNSSDPREQSAAQLTSVVVEIEETESGKSFIETFGNVSNYPYYGT